MEEIATSGILALIGKLNAFHAFIVVIIIIACATFLKLFRYIIKMAEKAFAQHISNIKAVSNLSGRVDEVERLSNGISKAMWGIQKELNNIRTQVAELRGSFDTIRRK
jgi:hypothetical protein